MRLYSVSALPRMPKGLRRKLYPNWVDLDLKAAQFAILAWAADIPEIKDFLLQRRSIWKELLNDLSLPDQAADDLKEVLYAFLFGGDPRYTGDYDYLTDQDVGRILGHPLLEPLVRARYVLIGSGNNNAEAAERFKTFQAGVEVPGIASPIRPAGPSARDMRSFLSQVAQAVEAVVIAPAFEVAKANERFKIVLYQFDGFSVHGDDKRNLKAGINKVITAANARCEALGVPTKLLVDG